MSGRIVRTVLVVAIAFGLVRLSHIGFVAESEPVAIQAPSMQQTGATPEPATPEPATPAPVDDAGTPAPIVDGTPEPETALPDLVLPVGVSVDYIAAGASVQPIVGAASIILDRVVLSAGQTMRLGEETDLALVAVEDGIVQIDGSAAAGQYHEGGSYLHSGELPARISVAEGADATLVRLRLVTDMVPAAGTPEPGIVSNVIVLASGPVEGLRRGTASLYLAQVDIDADLDSGLIRFPGTLAVSVETGSAIVSVEGEVDAQLQAGAGAVLPPDIPARLVAGEEGTGLLVGALIAEGQRITVAPTRTPVPTEEPTRPDLAATAEATIEALTEELATQEAQLAAAEATAAAAVGAAEALQQQLDTVESTLIILSTAEADARQTAVALEEELDAAQAGAATAVAALEMNEGQLEEAEATVTALERELAEAEAEAQAAEATVQALTEQEEALRAQLIETEAAAAEAEAAMEAQSVAQVATATAHAESEAALEATIEALETSEATARAVAAAAEEQIEDA
jgi:hypothetical protein